MPSKTNHKTSIIYLRGLELDPSVVKLCNKQADDLKAQLKICERKYKIYNGCSSGLKNVKKVRKHSDGRTSIFLDAHGKSTPSGHFVYLSNAWVPTQKALASLPKDGMPLHVELFSCFSSSALETVASMPAGSSLVTHSSADAHLLGELKHEEELSCIKEFGDNPFINYVITILLSVEQNNGISVKTNTGIKKFIAQLPTEACSQSDIELWQSSAISNLKFFFQNIMKEQDLPSAVEVQIGEAVAFIEDQSTLDRVQIAHSKRIQELQLINAAHKNAADKTKCLLEFVPPNVTTIEGLAPLHIAAQHNGTDVIRLLIAAHSDLNMAVAYDNSTALQMASQMGHTNIVEQLVAAGADPNKAIAGGWTALHMAAQAGHLSVVQALLKSGVHADMTNDNGFAAIHMVTQHGHTSVLEALIAVGANIDAATDAGFTPLRIASCYARDPSTVKVLLQHHAEVDSSSKQCIHNYMRQLDSLVAGALTDAGSDEL